jgi:hypothetical protein
MNVMICSIVTTVFSVICFCYGYGVGKSNKKREYIPMKFESKPIKVLVVQEGHFKSSEEMARTEFRIKRDIKDGVVFLPNDYSYEFGEVERVVIKGSDGVI